MSLLRPGCSASSTPRKAWCTRCPSVGCLQRPCPDLALPLAFASLAPSTGLLTVLFFTALHDLLCHSHHIHPPTGFLNGSVGKEFACNAGGTRDGGLIPVSGRSPGGGNYNPLQYSCLGNPMERGAWRATVQRVAKSRTQLSD